MLIDNARSFAPHAPGEIPADVRAALATDRSVPMGINGTEQCGDLALTWEVVTDPERFAALRDEWNALWLRAATPRGSQQFDWLWTGWSICAKPRGFGLWVLVVRRNGLAVAGWPFMIRRRGGIRIAESLGSQATEFDPLLMAADLPDTCGAQGNIDALLWDLAARHLPADLVCAAFVRAGSSRDRVLAQSGRTRQSETLPSPVVDFTASGKSGSAAWDAYWASRPKGMRRSNERRTRRLADEGVVVTRWLTDPGERTATIDRILAAKIQWMRERNLRNHFLDRPDYREFLVAMATVEAAPGMAKFAVQVLERDGRFIAGKLGTIDRTRFESFISTYDPAFEPFSPGTILQAECLRWCAENGLEYDMRIGAEAYKFLWSTRDDTVTTYWLAISGKGALYIHARRSLHAWHATKARARAAIPDRWRNTWRSAKALLSQKRSATTPD